MSKAKTGDAFKEELNAFPDLSFWYGLSFEELARMPNWAIRLYAVALSRLRAEYEIIHNRAASFAHMKKQSQRSIMANLNRRASEGREPRKVDKSRYTGTLAGIGFGVDDQRTKAKESKQE